MTTEHRVNSERDAGLNLLPRIAVATMFGVTLLTLVYAHIRLAGSENYVGMLGPLDRAFDLAFAASLTVLVISLGRALARALNLKFLGAAETFCFSLFLGTGVFGLTILLLGLVGILRPLPVGLVSLLILILTRKEVVILYRLLVRSLGILATTKGKFLLALFGCFTLLLILRASTPPYVFDENIYHMPVTAEFVKQGRVIPCFNNSMGNQPFLIHMIYAVCLLAGSDIAAKFFSLILALATALSLYAFSQRFLSPRIGILAAFSFFAAGMVTEVAVTTRVDVSVAGMLFVATYSMINYLETSRRGWLWLSALLAGFSLGIKHSAALWILLIGALYVVESLLKKRHDAKTVLKRGIVYGVIAIAIASPWYLKNYVWFGNPFYPFFTGELAEFGSHGLRYFDKEDEHKLDTHFNLARVEAPALVQAEEKALSENAQYRPERHPMRPWELYLKPNIYLMAEGRHLPNYLFLIIPLLFVFPRNRWILWLLALSCCYFVMATWTSWIARFLLPTYPALTIVMAYTVACSSDWLKEKLPLTRLVPAFVVAAALLFVVFNCVLSLRETQSLRYVSGRLSRSDFMLSFPYYRPIEFINRQLPSDARVLSIGAQMTYGMRRDYEADETWYTTKWRRLLIRNNSLQAVNEDLKRQGIAYVLYTPDLFLFAAQMGLDNGQAVPSEPRPLVAMLMGRQTGQTSDGASGFEEAKRLGSDFPLLRSWTTFGLYRNKFLDTVYSDENGYRIYRIR